MTVKVFSWCDGASSVEEFALGELPRLARDPRVSLWVDICSPQGDPELEALLASLFGLHPTVLEDVFLDAPHPKVEEFDGYLYLVAHGLDRNAEAPEALETVELDLLFGARWLVTHHRASMRSIEGVESELRKSPRLFARGPSFLAHAILDHLADHYKPLLERFDDEVEALEAKVLDETHDPTKAIFALKRSLSKMKRIATHQHAVAQRLALGGFARIDPAALPFFRDVADHFLRVVDSSESNRELLGSLFETYKSLQAHKLGEVMKMLTILSTIMLPLTFIAGIYGMNFEFMPELHWRYGYAFAIGLMLAIVCALLLLFRRRRWL